jgi:type 1 glutamine amidotransferase
MTPDAAPVTGEQLNGKWKKMIRPYDPMMPIAWTWQRPVGAKGRVFTSTIGGAMAGRDDFANEAMRWMFVNACYWALGLEEKIPPRADVEPVVQPNLFKRGARPQEVQP